MELYIPKAIRETMRRKQVTRYVSLGVVVVAARIKSPVTDQNLESGPCQAKMDVADGLRPSGCLQIYKVPRYSQVCTATSAAILPVDSARLSSR